MSTLSTHVLDTARGRPAAGVQIVLEAQAADPDGGRDFDAAAGDEPIALHPNHAARDWRPLAAVETDEDGRVSQMLPDGTLLAPGTYRLTFDTASYHRGTGQEGFYPRVSIEFTIEDAREHYHVPLLISPYGFSTYRGS